LQLTDDCFSVATHHRENVATSPTTQRGYGHVVTRVATPKDSKITEKTSTNTRAEKRTQHVLRNTKKTNTLRFPPSAPSHASGLSSLQMMQVFGNVLCQNVFAGQATMDGYPILDNALHWGPSWFLNWLDCAALSTMWNFVSASKPFSKRPRDL